MWKKVLNWRTIWAVVCLVLAFVAFGVGVTTTERGDVIGEGFGATIYYTVTLFVFGGADLGTPQGGPGWGRMLLWISYFAAPLLTVSTVVEAIARSLEPGTFYRRFLNDHTLLVGGNHLQKALFEHLEESEPEREIVLVDEPENETNVREMARKFGAKCLVLPLLGETAFERLQIERAQRIMLLSDQDCANLEAGARVLEAFPEKADQLIIHIRNLVMLREIQTTKLFGDTRVFNGHQIAARRLVQTMLREHFEATALRDVVVLAGFGRFGQAILTELQERADEELHKLIVVDENARTQTSLFDTQIGFSGDYDWMAIDGKMDDPTVWNEASEVLEEVEVPPVFILGASDEDANLRTALWLASRFDDALIVVRSYYHPALTRRMGTHGEFEVYNVGSLLEEGLEELV